MNELPVRAEFQVRSMIERVADRGDVRRIAEEAAVCVIEVDDRAVGLVRSEQLCLRVEVGGHVAVVVEMVLAQVREDRHREVGAIDPMEVERMRGDFHGHGLAPGSQHLGQCGLELRCFRCRAAHRSGCR